MFGLISRSAGSTLWPAAKTPADFYKHTSKLGTLKFNTHENLTP